MQQTFIEQLREWRNKGVLDELIEWGIISSETYVRMEIIDYYEQQVANGTPHAAKETYLTFGDFTLGSWKKFKHDMYITPDQKRKEKLRRWDREKQKGEA